jgi:hypothetical protein
MSGGECIAPNTGTCAAPGWLRFLREAVCRSRAQWEWLQGPGGWAP